MEHTQSRLDVEKFDGKGDFGLWKHKVLCQLELMGLESVLEEVETSQSEPDKQDEGQQPGKGPKFVEKDKRVKNLIKMCLSDQILRKVMKEPTAAGIWKALETDYQAKTLPNRIYLKQRFASFKMEENKSIEENLDSFQKLVDDLARLNISISDEDQDIQLLTSLPPLYEALVHTLKYGSGKDTLSVSDVTTSAYSKEVELKEKGLLNRTRGNSEGLYVESRGRSERRSEKGNYKPRSKSRGRSKSRPKYNKNTTGCFLCGKEGHWKGSVQIDMERSQAALQTLRQR